MEKLFVYGVLKNPEIQKKVIGRIAEGEESSLSGYKKGLINIEGEIFPILEKTRNRFDFVFGEVIEVSNEELKKIDEYKTDNYKRIKVVLANGEYAWVYVRT